MILVNSNSINNKNLLDSLEKNLENSVSIFLYDGYPAKHSSKSLALKLEEILNMDFDHLLIIENDKFLSARNLDKIINIFFNLKGIDFYQISGGRRTKGLFRLLMRNFPRFIALKIVNHVSLETIDRMSDMASQKYKVLKSANRYLAILKNLKQNISTSGRNKSVVLHPVLSGVVRPPLDAYFVSRVWVEHYIKLSKIDIFDSVCLNRAMARSNNYVSNSLPRLLK
jgi:hypothetical protein